MSTFSKLKYFDWFLFAGIVLLSLVGLMMIYSTGLAGIAESTLWTKQLAALALGFFALFFFSSQDYQFLRKGSSFVYLVSIALLLAVLFFGQEIRGARRWFDLGFVNFQAAEFSKFALIILLAKYFQVRQAVLARFGYVLLSFLYVLPLIVLIMFQPDLGSAVAHLVIWVGLLFVSPMPRRFFLYLLVIFLIVAAFAWQFFLAGYQKDRIYSFLDPTADPLGHGYNVIQSVVAVGSGGVWGTGLARGLQSQLKFLPERQTDFIFASTAEELGLVGGGLVLLFLGFSLLRMGKILRGARDYFGVYLVAGVWFLLITQSVINIGMNLGLLPVTGVTLPFLSYGGSSLVVMLSLIGIVESVARHSIPVRFR